MINKNKLIIPLILSLTLLSACKSNDKTELGEIKVSNETNSKTEKKEIPKYEVDFNSITVDNAKKNENKNMFNIATINDGATLKDLPDNLFSENHDIKNFIASGYNILYKKQDNSIVEYNRKNGAYNKVSDNKDDYNPYKFGEESIYILNINDLYKVIDDAGNGAEYKFSTDKDVVSAGRSDVYLFKDGKFFVRSLKENKEREVKVKLNDKDVKIITMFDRADNRSLVFHVGTELYIVKTSDISGDILELKPVSKMQVSDVKKVLKDKTRNDSGYTTYISTDNKIKVYNKFNNSVTHEIPDIITSRLGDNIDALVVPCGKDMVFYFSNSEKTYRYATGEKQLFEVIKNKMELPQRIEGGILILDENKISNLLYIFS